MKQRDILALMDGIAPGIAASFAKAITPVLARLDAAEKRTAELEELFKAWPKREDMAVEIAGLVKAAVDQAKAELTPPKTAETATLELKVDDAELKAAIAEAVAGITVDFDEVGRVVDERLAKAVGALPKVPTAAEVAALVAVPVIPTAEEIAALVPPAEPGKSVTVDDVRPMIEETIAREVRAEIDHGASIADAITKAAAAAVAALPPAAPGKDATDEQVAALLKRYLTDNPPKDGESVTVEQLRPIIEREVASQMTEIPTPKDGVGLAGMLIDRDGELVATLTDGTTKKLGPVVGKDGEPGVGHDDATEELADDGRTVIRRYVRGDQVKEFRHTFAVVLDRGVFKDGTEYVTGDGVTFGGSFWIAQATTKDKPGNSESWRLAVKKGRDGKDGRDLGPPPPLPKVKL